MNKKCKNQPLEAVNSIKYNSFNFELWAALVRPQLIAALQKRSEEK